MRLVRRITVLVVAAGTLAAGCGGGSSSPGAASTKAGWMAQHGAAVSAVGSELALARTALNAGDRQSVLGACSLLSDDVTAARKGLPVPNASVDTALRAALDAVAKGATDCFQGAQVASVASLNETAMAELATASGKMDAYNQAAAAWS